MKRSMLTLANGQVESAGLAGDVGAGPQAVGSGQDEQRPLPPGHQLTEG